MPRVRLCRDGSSGWWEGLLCQTHTKYPLLIHLLPFGGRCRGNRSSKSQIQRSLRPSHIRGALCQELWVLWLCRPQAITKRPRALSPPSIAQHSITSFPGVSIVLLSEA